MGGGTVLWQKACPDVSDMAKLMAQPLFSRLAQMVFMAIRVFWAAAAMFAINHLLVRLFPLVW
jgi:hypothetical protein